MKKYLKKKRFYFLLCSLIIFLLLMILVLKNGVLNIDVNFYEFMKDNIIKDNYTQYVKILTNLGGSLVLILFSFILIFFVHNKKIVIAIIFNLIMAFLLNELLKIIFRRPRPDSILWLENVQGYSFPSGHSMVSMAYYGFLIYLFYISNYKYRWLLISLLVVIILLIGLSRVYLGVHYLSDVLSGFVVSIIYLVCFITVYEKYINST